MIGIVSALLIASGFCFFLATSIGILRFPDFYCRMHAAGKGDTLSTLLILTGLALLHLEHFSGAAMLVSIKIMFIAVFIFMASPTASHAILDAGFSSGDAPWVRKDGEGKPGKEES
jgi:multicomponent Na+:H+ antiporter subunit G